MLNLEKTLSEIKYKMTGVSGFGMAQTVEKTMTVDVPTLSPPAPVTPAADAIPPPPATAATAAVAIPPPPATAATAAVAMPSNNTNAKDLLDAALKKLYLSTPNNDKLDYLIINNYNEYHETYMGSHDPNSFMSYIKDRNIFYKVQQFITNITYKGKINNIYVFTLHDIINLLTPVSKLNNKSKSFELSDYCKARDVFIKILQFIQRQYYEKQKKSVDFVYPPRSGLKKSSTTCNPAYGADDNPLNSVDETVTFSQVFSGGSKSRRTRRRKHSRKSHHKHARKTHHKRAPKSHKRKRHSRAARKHKKHTSRR